MARSGGAHHRHRAARQPSGLRKGLTRGFMALVSVGAVLTDRGRILRGPRCAGRHHRVGRPAPRRPAIQRQQHEHPAHRPGLTQRPGRQRPALVHPEASARGRFRRRRLQHQHPDTRARRRRRQSRRLFDPARRLGALQRRPGIQPHQDQRGLRAYQAVRRAKARQPGCRAARKNSRRRAAKPAGRRPCARCAA